MALTQALSESWRRLLAALRRDSRQRLIEVLRDEYIDAASDVAQFREHARRMIYPGFRDRLLRIAEEENAHVEWLREKLRALGGEIPERILPVKNGRNSWECLLLDAEEEQRDSGAALERFYMLAERTDPEIAAGLRRIHDEEKRHREEILDMLARSDPQAADTIPSH